MKFTKLRIFCAILTVVILIASTPVSFAQDVNFDLASLGVIFEINTGAMFRGYRTEPYPSLPLLRRMKELGCKIMINGDSHSTEAKER